MRPNILYFVVHDLGMHLGCYGAGVRTPNLDAFAADGGLMERSYCTSTACSPSRGCAMTGQYAHTNGLMGLVNTGWSMPAQTRTIVDYLSDAGYQTAHFGFQHERWAARENRYEVEGYERYESSLIENTVASALRFLDGRDESRPFYLNCGTLEVHGTQWMTGQPSNRNQIWGTVDQPAMPGFIPDEPQFRTEMGYLQACTEYMDAQIQPLLDAVGPDTLCVFTTDHGLPGMRGKGSLYVKGLEIATMFRMPSAIPAGTRVPTIVQNIDMVPTLLEAAGLPIPDEVQGHSYWPALTGGTYVPRERTFYERNWHGGAAGPFQAVPADSTVGWDPMRSVRTGRYTYIRNFDPDAKRAWLPHERVEYRDEFKGFFDGLWPAPTEPRDEIELFDRAVDPGETVNVVADPAYADVAAELGAAVDDWMRQTSDPLLDGFIPDRTNPWPAEALASGERGDW